MPKNRKASTPITINEKSVTESDLTDMKRILRTVKSAESLTSGHSEPASTEDVLGPLRCLSKPPGHNRTCLQKTNQTFKTTQSLGCFGEGPVRISAVLRYCIPELYLGLSSNPELCFSCKEDLRISYIFKKKCLKTENILGDFLKSSRTTGKSIDLHDVLAKIEEKSKTDTPTTNEFKSVSKEMESSKTVLKVIGDKSQFLKDVPQDLKGFCKISHVYSVNSNQVIANNSNLDNTSSVNNEARIEEDIVEIKEEPLDDLNGQESFNPAAMDEETLSASETASYEDLSSSNVDVQNLIDKIANIEHPDQYIDIPDFVTINNVGFKEFEEYKHMEIDESGVVQLQVEPKPSKEISGPTPIPLPVVAPPVAAPLGIVPPASSDSSNTDQTGTVVVDEMKEELKMLKVLSDMPDVLFVDGKRMVKCGNGYVEELKPSHLNFVDAFSKLNQKPRLGGAASKKSQRLERESGRRLSWYQSVNR
ncbi:hypothetical protein NQ315_010896 [Exocentrus adspersus]|uniref:Uncharacterized protein n=1 Tax=Exocentrus adspersus TaxID=1586481 RepID=A0AAV8VP90_9CUCU|nr:hypothetical protein NQ315_010896 [Exocentrus adspersus]